MVEFVALGYSGAPAPTLNLAKKKVPFWRFPHRGVPQHLAVARV